MAGPDSLVRRFCYQSADTDAAILQLIDPTRVEDDSGACGHVSDYIGGLQPRA
jgi:hypothetical protein